LEPLLGTYDDSGAFLECGFDALAVLVHRVWPLVRWEQPGMALGQLVRKVPLSEANWVPATLIPYLTD
jgi:hypothetical protein